jgi:hypothetical protein
MKIHLKYILTLLGNISKYIQNITGEQNQIQLDEKKLVNIFKVISDSKIFDEKDISIEVTTDFGKQVSDLTDNFRDLFIVNEKVFLLLLSEYLQHNITNIAEIYEGDEIKIKYALTKFSLLLSQTKKCMSNASNNFYACCLLAILNVENKLDQIKQIMTEKEESTHVSSDEENDIFMDGGNKNDYQIIVSIILNLPYKVIVKISEGSELVEEVVEEDDEEDEKVEFDYPEEEEGEEDDKADGGSNIQQQIKDIFDENPQYKEKTQFNVVEISSMISMIQKSPLPFHIKQARINMFYKIDI